MEKRSNNENCDCATRKHFPGHRGMAMPDRFWVTLKNQTNFEILSTAKIVLPKICQIFDL